MIKVGVIRNGYLILFYNNLTLMDKDSVELIRFKMLEYRFNNNLLSLNISSTSVCNFRCVYRYGKN